MGPISDEGFVGHVGAMRHIDPTNETTDAKKTIVECYQDDGWRVSLEPIKRQTNGV